MHDHRSPSHLGARAALLVALATACQVAPAGDRALAREPAGQPALQPDLPVSAPPYLEVRVDWKQRLSQPYAYVEARGSYTGIGALLAQVHADLAAQGVEPAGPPFGLYYDDPGRVAADALRMRACFPIAAEAQVRAPLQQDVLPSTTVVYAFASGPYPDVPRCYPALFRFLEQLAWKEDGPVREVYLVNPALVSSWDELVTEVQIPAASGR